MSREPASNGKLLAFVLSSVFLCAMVMGAGPGIYLINPDPADPNARVAFLGMPVVYVWVAFWFSVQAAVVLIAYFALWDRGEQPGS